MSDKPVLSESTPLINILRAETEAARLRINKSEDTKQKEAGEKLYLKILDLIKTKTQDAAKRGENYFSFDILIEFGNFYEKDASMDSDPFCLYNLVTKGLLSIEQAISLTPVTQRVYEWLNKEGFICNPQIDREKEYQTEFFWFTIYW